MKSVPETRPPLEQVQYSHGKFMQRTHDVTQHGQNPSGSNLGSATKKCVDNVSTAKRAQSIPMTAIAGSPMRSPLLQ